MKLVRRTTGEVIYDVTRRVYPNRHGYTFGGSVEYRGHTVDGEVRYIPAKEITKYVDGYSIGEIWYPETTSQQEARIVNLVQVSKNKLLVLYRYEGNNAIYNDEVEGRIVEERQ